MSKTDKDFKAYITLPQYMEGMAGLWNKVRIEAGGFDVNIPLIGSGLSNLGLPETQILQLILISLLKAAKQQDLGTHINIILRDGLQEAVDLDLIRRNWQ